MRTFRICTALIIAVFSGVLLSIAYVNPYTGTLSISEIVMQLSGSRGELPLELYLQDLVSFSLRMIPGWVFECYFGVAFYQHFCTASVYVFSRRPDRIGWYLREAAHIGIASLAYQLALMGAVVFTTMLRYQVYLDSASGLVFLIHWIAHSLWIFSMTVLINLASIRWGSSGAFGTVIGAQVILIVLLKVASIFPAVLRFHPIAWLVLGWQDGLGPAFHPPYSGLFFGTSLLYLFIGCVVVLAVGAVVVSKYDLLVIDSEAN